MLHLRAISSFLFPVLLISEITPVLARWPDFVNGQCELGKYYCGRHLKKSQFPRYLTDDDKLDARNIYKCQQSITRPGTTELEWSEHCEPTREMMEKDEGDPWCFAYDSGYRAVCWNEFKFSA